jgi:hypothetical protein
MIGETPTDSVVLTHDFEAAYARVNRWRGHMVENFSRAEQAVTETLVAINAAGVAIHGRKFPHLVGQRFDRLNALLTAGSESSPQRMSALSALLQFRAHEELRTMLCHAVTKIALERSGAWVALMKLIVFKDGSTTTTRQTIDEIEAEQRLEILIQDRQRLGSALGQVRREITDRS